MGLLRKWCAVSRARAVVSRDAHVVESSCEGLCLQDLHVAAVQVEVLLQLSRDVRHTSCVAVNVVARWCEDPCRLFTRHDRVVSSQGPLQMAYARHGSNHKAGCVPCSSWCLSAL